MSNASIHLISHWISIMMGILRKVNSALLRLASADLCLRRSQERWRLLIMKGSHWFTTIKTFPINPYFLRIVTWIYPAGHARFLFAGKRRIDTSPLRVFLRARHLFCINVNLYLYPDVL